MRDSNWFPFEIISNKEFGLDALVKLDSEHVLALLRSILYYLLVHEG